MMVPVYELIESATHVIPLLVFVSEYATTTLLASSAVALMTLVGMLPVNIDFLPNSLAPSVPFWYVTASITTEVTPEGVVAESMKDTARYFVAVKAVIVIEVS
jgi:hypothetical protein